MTFNGLVRVIIPTVDRSTLLQRTLDSLAACSMPIEFQGVHVVENGQQQDARDIVARAAPLLKATYSHSAAKGKSAALNEVLESYPDDFIVFLDDDVRVDSELLVAYTRAAAESSQGYFFGGPFAVDYEAEPIDWLKSYLPGSALGWQLQDTGPVDVKEPCFLGFNWAAYASDLRNIGGFSPLYGPGSRTGCPGQETEAQHRLLRAGVVGKYVPDAMVWHYVPKQRCSPRWVVQRSYRRGIRIGFERGNKFAVAARIVPAAAAWGVCNVTALTSRIIPISDQRQFAVQRYASLRRGYLRGLLLSLMHPPDSYQPRRRHAIDC